MFDAVAGFAPDDARTGAVPRATFDDVLDLVVAEDPRALVAVLDLGLHHLSCTKEYAVQFGRDQTNVQALTLFDLVGDAESFGGGFDEMLTGELDFRTVDVQATAVSQRLTLHAAMIRGADATPWCIVIVANPVPQLAPTLSADRYPRSMRFPAPATVE